MWADELRALGAEELHVFHSATAFVKERLDDVAMLEWALKLDRYKPAERLAVRSLFEYPMTAIVKEPWLSAWRWLIEMWAWPGSQAGRGLGKHEVQRRIKSGERTARLATEIVDLVRPWVEVEAASSWAPRNQERRAGVRKLGDLIGLRLTSGDLVRPRELGLAAVDEGDFILDIADKLDAAVRDGIHLGKRLGWNGVSGLWKLGDLRRVYYADREGEDGGSDEPDQFHRGIAPSVKLLYGTVELIATRNGPAARAFTRLWSSRDNAVHVRLWAAGARMPALATPEEVYTFLSSVRRERFWDQSCFPEIAELRARRFAEFTATQQREIARKLLRRPPASYWPATVDKAKVEDAREFWALRELRRIEVAGATLPSGAAQWAAARISRHPDIARMTHVTDGFDFDPRRLFEQAKAEFQYDVLEGDGLLGALEAALAAGQFSDATEQAHQWLRIEGKLERVVTALEAGPQYGAAYARVWEAVAWQFPSGKYLAPAPPAETERKQRLAGRIVNMLLALPTGTLRGGLDGITHWLSDWAYALGRSSSLRDLTLRLWPLAVEATNRTKSDPVSASERAEQDPYAQLPGDVVGSPAGQLAEVFGVLCPPVREGERPLEADIELAQVRDQMASAAGYAGLLARYSFTRQLAWHLAADPAWAGEHLIKPLMAKDQLSFPYWHAVAFGRENHLSVLKAIGERQAKVASDSRLSAETRSELAERLVFASLFELWSGWRAAVPHAAVEQMLRSVDEEVRAAVAHVPERFVKGRLKDEGNAASDPAMVFYRSVKPFLDEVWPLERSLVTPVIAKAFASLPAACGSAFVDAVATIDRFIVPFETWSLSDFGIIDFEGSTPRVVGIDDRAQAVAALSLVDRSVGYRDGARTPYDLGSLLEHFRGLAPELEHKPEFERLVALSRR